LSLTPVASASAAQPLTGRVLVTLKPAAAGPQARAAAAAGVAARAGARARGPAIPHTGVVVLEPAAGSAAGALTRRLRADPAVADARLERRFSLRYVPNDPAMGAPEATNGAPAGTTVQWWAQRQGLPTAWDIARGAGALVAIIDTGVDATHPELDTRIVDTADFDDTPGHGPATVDEVGHGTHVASLACATADNAIGIAGAGFGCGLLIAKTDLAENSVARSILWAADRGAQAINMSFGTDGTSPASPVLTQAIEYALARNVVLVAAAADEDTTEQGDPANVLQPTGSGANLELNKGLSVTAAQANDQRAGFAGRGSQISLAAYGAFGSGGPPGLLGAFPAGETELEQGSFVPPTSPCRCRTTFQGDSRYAYMQGTSMAAPVVTAVAALVRRLNPDLPAAEVVRLMKQSARRAPGAGWTDGLGWGILDAGEAMKTARRLDRRAPHSRLRGPGTRTVTGQRFRLRWTAADGAPRGVVASGLASYEVWRSVNGAAPNRVARTKHTALTMSGRRGQRLSFFTVAIDRAGNREAAPLRPDAKVRIAGPVP
jgi:subtilisin family serine protease